MNDTDSHPDPEPSDPIPSIELLESAHVFPGRYTAKAIGLASDDFVERVLAEARVILGDEGDFVHRVRATPGGRHVAVSLDLGVESAEQVRAVYSRLIRLEGLVMLL